MRVLFSLLLCCATLVAQPQEERVVAAYFAEWGIYGRDYHVQNVPADDLTHLIYAFAKVSTSGEVELFDSYAATDKAYPGDSWDEDSIRGNFKQLRLLKERHPHLKTLIAIGGWTLSEPFSNVAADPTLRARFVNSAIEFMQHYGFDGIDIDWEYPVSGGLFAGMPQDTQNCTALMRELRAELDRLEQQSGQHYYLTMASPAGEAMGNIELAEVGEVLDWYNLMAYDYHGAWENTTGHNAALSDVEASVNVYLAAGVPADKIVLGLPLYSRAWSGVGSDNGGLNQRACRSAQGTWEPGILDYSDLYAKIAAAPEAYLLFEDEAAGVSWVYNPDLDGGTFFTYDDCNVMKRKLAYIEEARLRGAMFWELSGDLREGEERLIPFVSDRLK